jgi:5'-AMP-activated protein kinase catalytic alpha subunit
MIAGKKYAGQGSDIWSSGIVLYAMTCGYLPFEDKNTSKLYKKILACDYVLPGFVSVSLRDLIKKVLNTDPAKRITVAGIRSHEWYQKTHRANEMEGLIVGRDSIPIIQEVKGQLEAHFSGDQLADAATFI